MNLSELMEKIGAISTSIAIYKRDLRNFIKELKEEFDFVDIEDAEERMDDIDAEVIVLQEKEKKLYKQAKKLLKDVEDATTRNL
jgi:predicted  nucleic acid-binding Zn-ribbon protein